MMKRVIKPLKYLFIAIFILLFLVSATIAFLPKIVSTNRSRSCIERYMSNTLKCPIQIDSLSWKWKDGIALHGVRIEDDPTFSNQPILSIEEALLKLSIKKLLKRRLVLDVVVNDISANLIIAKDGQTNVGPILSSLQSTAPEPPAAEKDEWTFAAGSDGAWYPGMRTQHEAFIRCIRNGDPVLCDGAEARKLLRVCLAAERAVAGETSVSLL